MSYNIDTWKIRSLTLELPLDFDFSQWLLKQPTHDARGHENIGIRWCKEEDEPIQVVIDSAAQTWELVLLNQSLLGNVADGKLLVTDLEWTDDFSGYLYSDVLLPLFKEFRGSIDAIMVWEHGDTIERLTIRDGEISVEEIA